MSRHGFDVATWAAVREVATWKRCRDIGEAPGGRDQERLEWCRDMLLVALMSRHRSEVATWGRLPGAVHYFVHCSGHCLGTVHSKKKYKIQNF